MSSPSDPETVARAVAQRRQALADAQKMVEQARRITQDAPAAQAELGDALATLARRLLDMGRVQSALDAAQEAVSIYRQLVRAEPEVYQAGLAHALNTLAGILPRVE